MREIGKKHKKIRYIAFTVCSLILIVLFTIYVSREWIIFRKISLESGIVLQEFLRVILLTITDLWSFIFLGLYIYFQRRHEEELERQQTDALIAVEMKEFQLKQRVQRHDFHIHLMAISGLIQEESYDECQQYLARMITQAREVNQILPLDDPAVSAMLNQEIQNAKSRGVTISCEIHDDLSKLGLDAYGVNQILGNLIRNAVEAVESLEENKRKVYVTILQRRGNAIFRVENPVDAPVTDSLFTYGYSEKEGHSGIGLNGVKSLVKKHKGSIFPEQDEGIFRMVVIIPLKIK